MSSMFFRTSGMIAAAFVRAVFVPCQVTDLGEDVTDSGSNVVDSSIC